jgi:hypothetical protein
VKGFFCCVSGFVQQKHVPQLENINGKKGVSLHNLLTRFDRQAGYPFAWFFYMVKGKLVSSHSGLAVFKDISGDFSYLPERNGVRFLIIGTPSKPVVV